MDTLVAGYFSKLESKNKNRNEAIKSGQISSRPQKHDFSPQMVVKK